MERLKDFRPICQFFEKEIFEWLSGKIGDFLFELSVFLKGLGS